MENQGGRGGLSSWVDENDNVWFFSGIGISEDGGSGALSDFWYVKSIKNEKIEKNHSKK